MKRLVVLSVLMLSGCAALTRGDTPGCHGPRRPANPYGSVLAPSQPAPAAAPATAAASGCGRRAR